jgi:hypothetical protein
MPETKLHHVMPDYAFIGSEIYYACGAIGRTGEKTTVVVRKGPRQQRGLYDPEQGAWIDGTNVCTKCLDTLEKTARPGSRENPNRDTKEIRR